MKAEIIPLRTGIEEFRGPTPEFKRFWLDYPYRLTDSGALKKVGKSKCLVFEEKRGVRHYFSDAMAMVGIDALCEAAVMYGKTTEPKFIRDAYRWLRDGDYDTEYAEIVVEEVDRRFFGLENYAHMVRNSAKYMETMSQERRDKIRERLDIMIERDLITKQQAKRWR